jgi:hypothetical protein
VSCVGCARDLSLAHQPCPLDGCPMFADFRVHGLNTTFFQCFRHRSTTYLQEKKRRGRVSGNPGRPSCSTRVRESPRTWGTRPGGKAWWESGKRRTKMNRQHPDQTQANKAGQIPMPYRHRKGSSAYECLASTGSAVSSRGSDDRLSPSSFQLISNSSLRSRTASPRAPPK